SFLLSLLPFRSIGEAGLANPTNRRPRIGSSMHPGLTMYLCLTGVCREIQETRGPRRQAGPAAGAIPRARDRALTRTAGPNSSDERPSRCREEIRATLRG